MNIQRQGRSMFGRNSEISVGGGCESPLLVGLAGGGPLNNIGAFCSSQIIGVQSLAARTINEGVRPFLKGGRKWREAKLLAVVPVTGVLLQVGSVFCRYVGYVGALTTVPVYNREIAVAHILETKLLHFHTVASPLLYVGPIVGLPVFYIQTLVAEHTANGIVSVVALYNPLLVFAVRRGPLHNISTIL